MNESILHNLGWPFLGVFIEIILLHLEAQISKHDRLLRLEQTHREETIELNDEQIRLLERFSHEFRERQIEVHYTRRTGDG